MRISSHMPVRLGFRPRARSIWLGACLGCLLACVGVACGSSGSTSTEQSVPSCGRIATGNQTPPQAPDGASACPAGACNYQTQSGCSAGQACRPQFNGTDPIVNPGCEPAGTGVSQSACTKQSDCAPGYDCAGKECHKLCCGGDWSACDPGEGCFTNLDVPAGSQNIPSGASVCLPVNDCDPFTTGNCPAGRECKVVDARGSLACMPVSTAQEGDSCAGSDSCAQGLICGDGTHTCRKLCRAEVCGVPGCSVQEGTCTHSSYDPLGVGECLP